MIRVLFKDTHYEPWNTGDSDCSFTMGIDVVGIGSIEFLNELLNPSKYEDEVDGEYSYYEWVCERLDEAGVDYCNPDIEMTIEW